jgi:hypothetical protein
VVFSSLSILFTYQINLTPTFYSSLFSEFLREFIRKKVMVHFSHAGNRIFIATVTGFAISTVAVAIRVYCKYTAKSSFQLDDAWMIFAMLSFCATVGVTIWGKFGTSSTSMFNFIEFLNRSRERRGWTASSNSY